VGQIDHLLRYMEPLSKFLEYIFQVTGGVALSMRSIIVGTHFTGEEVNDPRVLLPPRAVRGPVRSVLQRYHRNVDETSLPGGW
jgi:hypothetical protein